MVWTDSARAIWTLPIAGGKPKHSDQHVARSARANREGWLAQRVLAGDLESPTHIAIDGDFVFVVSRDQQKIVRLPNRK